MTVLLHTYVGLALTHFSDTPKRPMKFRAMAISWYVNGGLVSGDPYTIRRRSSAASFVYFYRLYSLVPKLNVPWQKSR